MVAVKNISIAAALLSGAAHQALAAPISGSDLALRTEADAATDAALEARAFEIEERDLDERKINWKSFIKKAGRVAGGAAKLLLREEDLEGRDISELSEREIDELVERNWKSFMKKAGRVAGGAAKLLLRDEDLEERDFDSELEERDMEELFARYLDAADIEGRDLDERKINWKSFIKKAGRVAGGAAKLLLRDEDLEERDFASELEERDMEELFARYLDADDMEARDSDDLEERNFKSFMRKMKKVGKIAGGAAKLLLRDEDLEERDFDSEVEERDFDFELEERDFDSEVEERDFDFELEERDMEDLFTRYLDETEIEGRDLDERKINWKSFIKKAGRVAGGAAKLLLREEDLDGRDIELDERDLEYIFARYLQDEE